MIVGARKSGRSVSLGAVAALCASGCMAFAGAATAASSPITHSRIDRLERHYDVRQDLSYVETTDIDYTLLTARGIRERASSTFSFYPASQSLQVVEAWVDEPDGTRIMVGKDGQLTRPSESAENAPGFTGAMTTTVLYPQLREGSRTHVRWRLEQKTPPLLGFDVWAEPPLETDVTLGRIEVDAPVDLALRWSARGGFEVSDHADAGIRRVVATIHGTRAEETEHNMVAASDFQPLFLMTSLPSLRAMGAIYWRQSHDKAVVTPQIAALAARLAQGRSGEAAARAVYDWVTANIRYVALYLDPNDGWVPHDAATVLKTGYGDCKDHVVLMQALLAALGIRADAAMVDWGNRTTEAPLSVPQYNHAIVYLPDFNRYLNPTNPYASYDSLDRRLAGKATVIATPTGQIGGIAASQPSDQLYRNVTHVAVEPNGTVTGVASVSMTGNLENMMRALVVQAFSPGDLAERLLSATPEGGFGTFSTSNPRNLDQAFTMVGTWRSPHAVATGPRRMFFTVPVGLDVNPPSRLRQFLSSDGSRQHAVIAPTGDNEWRTTISVPEGMAFVRLPADVALTNGAGSYTAHYRRSGADVVVDRHLVIGRNVFQAAAYPDLEALLYAPLSDARAILEISHVDDQAASVQPLSVQPLSVQSLAMP